MLIACLLLESWWAILTEGMSVKWCHAICSYNLVLNSWQKASTIKIDRHKICRLLENAGTLVLICFRVYNSFLAAGDGICHCLANWTWCYQPETQHICHSFFSSWCFRDCCFRSLLRGVDRVIMHTFFMSICCYGITINPLTSIHSEEWKFSFAQE